jgi:hypothetical protein
VNHKGVVNYGDPSNFGEHEMKRRMLAVVAMLLAASPACAIDFTQPITDLDGSIMAAKPGDAPATLGTICEKALTAQYSDEMDRNTGKELITPEEKYQRWKLASKLDGKNVALSPEEITLLKKLVGKAYGPAIVGPVWTMLDPSLKKD